MVKNHLATGGKKYYCKTRYNVSVNITGLPPILLYFKFYPLKTQKYIVYFNWIKIYKIVVNKKHNYPKNLLFIMKYTKNMKKWIYNE